MIEFTVYLLSLTIANKNIQLIIIYIVMGSFRSQPELKKHTFNKEGPGFTYAVSHMCGKYNHYSGWRLYMEDAHINAALSDKKSYIFGIFDGHGGIFAFI